MIHIQQIAKQTGLTVRTLRHYDQIGLLQVSSRTEGGHRLYTEEDLKKLQQIEFLKDLGFRLLEIRTMLGDPGWKWPTALQSQLSYILEEQKRLKLIEQSLRGLIHGIAVEGGQNLTALQKLIQLSHRDKELIRSYRATILNEKELEMWQRLPSMNGEDPEALEWIALLGQIKRYMPDGPASPQIQSIIRRMIEKKDEAFGNDPEFINKLWELRKSPDDSEKLGLYPIEPEVLEFMDEAWRIYTAAAGGASGRQSKREDHGS